ncbi:MAG: SdiA-regulated domain-containing protein [Chitinophagaceae bacterium]
MRLTMHKSLFKILFPLFFMVTLIASCELFQKPRTARGYMMTRPQRMILEKKLNEISGLYYLQNEDALIAIADDKKKVFRITTDGKASDYYDPDLASADYEDLVKVNNTVYVLVNTGTIVAITKTDTGLATINYPFWSQKGNDFETIYYDSSAQGLIILCKSCAADKGNHERRSYKFNLSTRTFDTSAFYTISSRAVRDQLKDGETEFKPSGAAIHPLQKRLYVLASAGNMMIITDLRGKVQEVFRLNPALYPQAEGITFAANGDMYISNEAKLGKPTLLKIVYKSGK